MRLIMNKYINCKDNYGQQSVLYTSEFPSLLFISDKKASEFSVNSEMLSATSTIYRLFNHEVIQK